MTPRERLASFRAQSARVLRRALDQRDVTQAATADACGTTPQKVGLWCDHTRVEGPSVAHLPLMPREVAMAILSWCAEHHDLIVVERATASSTADHLGHLHRILKEGADVSVTYSGALVDGVMTPAESLRVESELRESIAAQTSTLEALVSEREKRWPRVVRGGAA